MSLSQQPPDAPAPTVNTQLLRALVAEGALSQSDADAAALYAKRRSLHVEEALLQAGYFDEARLLKFQANYYKTHFVSTQKLASAPIADGLLRLIPHKLANRYCVFPVRFDAKGGELMILTVEPDDLEVLKNVQWATRVPKVRALVARPAAIQAAIQVHYEDEPQAFGNIKQTGMMGGSDIVSERDRTRKITQTYEQPPHAGGRPPRPPGPPAPPGPQGPVGSTAPAVSMPPIHSMGPAPGGAPPPPPGQPMGLSNPPGLPVAPGSPGSPGGPVQPMAVPMPPPQAPAPPAPPLAPLGGDLSFAPQDASSTGTMDVQPMPPGGPGMANPMGMPMTGQPMQAPGPQAPSPFNSTVMGQGPAAAYDPGVAQVSQPGPVPQAVPMPSQPGSFPDAALGGLPTLDAGLQATMAAPVAPMPEPAPPPQPRGVAMHDYLETLNVLVALLESERGDLRGHSVSVARLSRRFCERLSVAQQETDSIVAASYLHDIGKSSAFHLTALNVAQYEQHRTQAKKSYLTPVRILESVRLPDKVTSILTHLYERHDGQGFPDHLAGKEILLGARILAIVETYADLTGHAANAFRKRLSAQEAWDVIAKYKGKIFDSNLVDVFKLVVLGDDLRAKLLSDSRRALLVDSDAEETTILELRLIEHGYEVTIARNSTEAENEMAGEWDVIISEVDVKPADGFELLEKLRGGGSNTPFVFLSKVAEGDTVQRGFELGADEFIAKPASPDVVALKINRVLESGKKQKKRTGGVSGSLTEMALPDVVQILYHGRKSGRLSITASGKSGEILFNEGQIFEASFGDAENEVAFYEMLSLVEGDFELDPSFSPTERHIEMNPESLLLEGMRRLDEVGR